MSYEDGLFEDDGILTSWQDHPLTLQDRSEVVERQPANPSPVRFSEFVIDGLEKGVSAVRRHKKTAAAVGGTLLGGIGFAAGATMTVHRHAH